MFRKSGKCKAGRLDFADIFTKLSILHKINTNTGKIDYKSILYIINKNVNEKNSSWPLNNTFNGVFTFVNV